MLKEFVEAISGLAVQAKEPKVFRDEFDPRKAYLVHDGLLRETTVAPPLLDSVVETFDALFAAVEHFGGEAASVWHSDKGIVALLDNADRLESVRLPLRISDQFKSLTLLPKSFDQRALVLFLKRNLAGAIDNTLISIFRQLDFTKREEGTGIVKHGDESLGRSVHGAVIGRSEIPEFLTVTVSLYTNTDAVFPVTIRLSVDIDVQRGMIELTPLPDEIEHAILATQNEIGGRLESEAPENVTVYYGSPAFSSK